MLALKNEAGLPWPVRTGEFEIQLGEDGIVRALAIGFWERAAVGRYFAVLTRFMDEARLRFGRAQVLVDKRDCPVQSAEVADGLTAGCLRYYRQTDRLAVVVAGNLAKMQARRVMPADRSAAFLAVTAAEQWLRTS